ncbi:MAG TPA: NnrS family protein [Tepidisphaeraceae bacterium]|jgi:hypothetical protein
MASSSRISPDQTVRQIASTFQDCQNILHRLPGARRGDRWTLQQLAPFARQAGVDERLLLQELSKVANVPVELKPPSRSPQPSLVLIFLALVVGLSLGTVFGVGLLLRIAIGGAYDSVPGASVHVHGIAQLWGWMTLFIFGVAAHVLRQNSKRPAPLCLDWTAAAFVLAGLIAFFIGLSAHVRANLPQIDIIGSSLLLGAAIFFAISVGWSLSGAVNGQRKHGLIFLVAWLLIWAVADLSLRIRYANVPVLPDSPRTLLIVLPVLGVATNAIYGFGLRLIPGLLNLRQLRSKWFAPALLMHNAGLFLFLTPIHPLQMLGSAFMLLGAIAYLVGLDLLRGKPSRPIYGIDPRGHILIRVAFFWLICGMTMIVVQQYFPSLPHAYSGAWRHALTVGFVTTMILGVGNRILPIFLRQPLASNRLMLLSAALIIIGNTGRVSLELLTIGGWTWSYRLMGLTGVLELAALTLFALNIAATAQKRKRTYAATQPLTPDTRVQEAVNVQPAIQERLRQLGITMFDDSPFIAPSMTLGALALASGLEPEVLIQQVR